MISDRSGFTLLELLVAIMLLGIVVAAATTALQAGMTGYRRGTAVAEATQRVRGGLALLDSDLQGSLVGPEATFAPDRIAVTLVAGSARPELRRVIYRVRQGRLERQLLRPGQRETAVSPVVVLDRAVDLRFEFLAGGVWAERAAEWPEAIRILGYVIEGSRAVPVQTAVALPVLRESDVDDTEADGAAP